MITIRHVTDSDADALLQLRTELDRETAFMMLEPGERTMDVEEQRSRLAAIIARDNQTIVLAEHAGTLVGFLSACGGEFRRNRATAYLVIGVLQAFAGQGIGSRLFAAAEEWAGAHGIHRLELTVMAHNHRAVHLYQKMGFEIEGTKRDSLCVDGVYVDEYAMAKLLTG